MKWTEEQATRLKELCLEGKSNSEIAIRLDCKVTDVYAKRSQLGITIDKCKGIEPNPEFEAAVSKPKRGIRKDVRQAFKNLDDAFLMAMAGNETSVEDAHIYAVFSQMAAGLRESLNSILRGE